MYSDDDVVFELTLLEYEKKMKIRFKYQNLKTRDELNKLNK